MKAEVLRLRTELEDDLLLRRLGGQQPAHAAGVRADEAGAESDITVFLAARAEPARSWSPSPFIIIVIAKRGRCGAQLCDSARGPDRKRVVRPRKRGFYWATNQRIGAFESAKGGTIFLDEVGDMQPALQASCASATREKNPTARRNQYPSH